MSRQFPSKLPERLRLPGLPLGLIERLIGMPRWALFLTAMAAIPIATVPAAGLARYTTASPSYCLSCHATGETPDRSTRSLVHAGFDEVTCVDCHAKAGQLVFEGYARGFMAEPDRVTQNCVRCHSNMTQTDEQVGFKRDFLGIRITHRSHLARGATCTTCHANVAHDLAVPQTNRPRMQACNTCHAVSDNCAKCHTQGIPTALPPVPVSTGPAETMADGRVYYLRVCSACHGPKGNASPKVDLSRQDVLAKLGESAIFKAAAQGHGEMPAFGVNLGGSLSDDQIRSIVGYLNSEAVGATEPDGKALYYRSCVVCHGENGDKVAGVQHSSAQFWANHSDSELLRIITRGQGAMPALGVAEGGPLTNAEVRAVLVYLEDKAGASRRPPAGGADFEALYQENCASCHGANGRQVPNANLAAKDFVSGLGEPRLITAIADGRLGMPAFGKTKGGKLSDADVKGIAQFILSLAGLAPQPNGNDATLVAQGKTLFLSNCAGCHGANGGQLASANLGSADFIKGRGDAALVKAIVEGKGGMPPMGKAKGGPIADDQAAAIVAYLKTLGGQ